MSVFLGVDGGGTKTNVVVVKEGKVLGTLFSWIFSNLQGHK